MRRFWTVAAAALAAAPVLALHGARRETTKDVFVPDEDMSVLSLDPVHERPTSWLAQAVLLQMRSQTSMNQDFIFFLGIAIAVFGATLTVLGLMVQKTAHMRGAQADEDYAAKCYCFSWRWIMGLSLFIAGNLVSWVSLGMGPNSVLACFNSWNIILAMVVAPMWFGETVTLHAKISAGILIAGCIWVTITGPRSYRMHSVESLSVYFHNLEFDICCIVLAVLLLTGKFNHWRMQHRGGPWTLLGITQVTIMAAICACYAVLFSKCTSMVVNSGVNRSISQQSSVTEMLGNNLAHWQFFVWAGATILCGVGQIHFLNESLRQGAASFVIPFYESSGMALQVAMGGVFFREYHEFTCSQHAKFWPGIAVVLIGLTSLAASAHATHQKANADSPEAPDADRQEDGCHAPRKVTGVSEPDRAAGGVL
mmetsp:Transcript_6498/g.13397  ORF Transcript_6498/g.13397 Transcript_6498/m.13397 type:complete len:424 (-) Transcript_6498:108-1379(-)